MKTKDIIISIWMLLAATAAQAQITIGGNVYGGGNAGDMTGNTSVTVRAGDIKGGVYGGARQANVGGHAFVNIDGEHMSDDIVINHVYGGNDIAGTIGNSIKTTDLIPSELTEVVSNNITETEGKNTKQYQAFVLTTKEREVGTGETPLHIFIGQLYGGGNGDYTYSEGKQTEGDYKDKYIATKTVGAITKVEASSLTEFVKPELGRTYLEIMGGTIAYLFGGGNSATVTSATDICIKNTSEVTTDDHLKAILNTDDTGLLTRMKGMGLNTIHTQVSSSDYQFGRVFGGNNVAPMDIRPTWHLKEGKIRDLYSGGNAGDMTYEKGILLSVKEAGMRIHNVYGGCRMADVNPDKNTITEEVIDGISFPEGYAARVLILNGNIDNVYGGNDVSGNVYGGNAVGIHSSINGDVYGGGNGSYAYTDKEELKNSDEYKDFYYTPGSSSVEALNAFRPNAEAVSIRVLGTAETPTVIGGAIYCGGNSATLRNDDPHKRATAQLKIGSYVIADKVFLGNNGENLVSNETLEKYADSNFSTLTLTDEDEFATYMDGVTMMIEPDVTFDYDAVENAKPEAERDYAKTYKAYSTQFGSFYCGGNVGSMKFNGAFNISFNDKVVIYNKVVGGSNEANVYEKYDGETKLNAQYLGGLLGDADGNGNKLILNFGGLKIQPKRWVDVNDKSRGLVWNTVDSRSYDPDTKTYTSMEPVPKGGSTDFDSTKDPYRRFQGGNIYGGCYSNGHVNGNVVINLNASLVDRKGENAIFDEVEENEGEAKLYDGNENIRYRNTGVLLGRQGMDPLGRGLNVFGGGYGTDSEIWGSTTINLNKGYTFQIFGGGEQGAIGEAIDHAPDPNNPTIHNLEYEYNEKYSTYINLRDQDNYPGTYRGDTDNSDHVVDYDDMAEAEFIYGGSFEGLIAGSTHINLGNGRIFNSFAGSCNADILGHTETYVGRNSQNDNDLGFPWIRDHIYGGNDLGGRILGSADFTNRVSTDIVDKVFNPKGKEKPDVLIASAYTEYIQGRVEYLFGGCYGDYDYTDSHFDAYTTSEGISIKEDGKPIFFKPWMDNAFVNFKPNNVGRNAVAKIYGAGQGHAYSHASDADRDKMQDRSYVLIDVSDNNTHFVNTEVFGAGDFSGVGMRNEEATTRTSNNTEVVIVPALDPTAAQTNANGVTASTVIDLMRGHLKDVYGASFKEGITRRTIVNVPTGSTIWLNRIFGGAYGLSNDKPCDVFESNINYYSGNATMEGYWIDEDIDDDGNLKSGSIYGGNNSARRTLYSRINIYAPVVQNQANGYTAKVFGAGYGSDTWAQYTEVNLNNGANVYEVYGGGYGGMVLNKQSVDKSGFIKNLSTGYNDNGLDDALVKTNPLGGKTNTNVYINKGAYVAGYAYGAGLGAEATVSGTTYIGLHGGTVNKDIYAAGWGGAVYDKYGVSKDDVTINDFVATTNAYIEGGMVRNCYGGGYEGAVGYHDVSTTDIKDDILGVSNVTIGIRKDQATLPDGYGFFKGVPAIQRNAYGAGEGGAVYGTANITLNNGYIGYVHLLAGQTLNEEGKIIGTPEGDTEAEVPYVEKLSDETWKVVSERKGRLKDCGNVFGGGYDDKSLVDFTNVTMWGGIVRSNIYGGGEIATVGRGKTHNIEGLDRGLESIDKPGKTHIEMYNGHVKRNVFGGGKGYNILGYGGTHELYTDGYVFGQTEVYIHGGEIGTEEGVTVKEDGTGGYGNVFGGGDVGYVFSQGYFNTKTQNDKNISTGSPGHHYYYSDYQCIENYGEYKKDDVINETTYNAMSDTDKAHWASGNYLTEDCKVVIAPYLQVKDAAGFSINGHSYAQFEYVPTDDLNLLPRKNQGSTALYEAGWGKLFTGDKDSDGNAKPDDPMERGVLIHNAVFAGGNVSSNNDKTYANATTVFGNSTATLYDVYHRDFITVGTEHIGGLYGGGNLSKVDGYRELNITNYGTDYYGQDDQITLEEYRKLSNRERAYFKLQYVCMTAYDYGGKSYSVGDKISEEDYNNNNIIDADHRNKTYWEQYGFCSIYAGRLLNTIQRADLCGVFGSRMVLQGARDRVAEVGSTSDYTINRVGELSLNKNRTARSATTGVTLSHLIPGDTWDSAADALHGNYFGIYSVVNYLGNLTSDVHFTDNLKTVTTNASGEEIIEEHNDYTYYTWKTSHLDKKDRNNGTCENQVALASGVFLELTTENSTPTKKDYGYVTGIVELDLINIKKDIEGGGYVYARNQHGECSEISHENTLLSAYNRIPGNEALTNKIYTYSSTALGHQTSGNFIHKRKRIVDDCYPNNGVYNDGYVKSPAHYWYIKGEVYIYDQIVSAYAGSASAYSKEVKIPLTITAASNGRLQLLNVQPNLYAYYADDQTRTEAHKITSDGIKVDGERLTLHLNDVVNWWDYHQLSDNEQKLFVKETYVNVDTCYVDGIYYPSGQFVLENDPSVHGGDASQTAYKLFMAGNHTILDKKEQPVENHADMIHPSNNISHETGYVLTFDMDSPKDWDDWYSPNSGSSTYTITNGQETTNRIRKENYDSSSGYIEGPTFYLNAANGLYGQRDYDVGELLSKEVYTDYTTTVSQMETQPTGQAVVAPAYVAISDCKVNGTTVVVGNAISKSEYDNYLSTAEEKAHFEEAMLCVNTIQLGEEEYILRGELVAKSQFASVAGRFREYNNSLQNADKLTVEEAQSYVADCLTDAYICTSAGKYGGQYFKGGTNYSALKAWCSLPDERSKFRFNYDAFDVLTASDYPGEGHTDIYDGGASSGQILYSASKPVEYVATYTGDLSNGKTFVYKDNDGTSHTISNDAERSILREDFEKILNEQCHYTRINVAAGGQTTYIVLQNFIDKGTPYAKGQDLSEKDYNSLSTAVKNDETKVKAVTFENESANPVVQYYCYESYGSGESVVNVGTIKNAATFAGLENYQKAFTIQGKEPTQTSTLYVSRESNAKDVTSEKVITVVYQYTYYEPDDEGEGVSLSHELHVVNIHLQLESGAPEVGPLSTPPTVLPGHKVGLKAPYVNPGLYEVINNGWEIFTDEQDAIHHRNGKPFYNNVSKLYWYENQKRWVAFYSNTYLGKTYSNPVLMSVANYHDLDEVMQDKDHHMYVDHPEVIRNSKIYIDDRDCVSDPAKSELDLLKDFFDLSLQSAVVTTSGAATEGHALLDSHVRAGRNLDFILNSDVRPKAYTTWTPIGYNDIADDPSTTTVDESITQNGQCFDGTLHGDGYTINGLDNSLFDHLCGEVYNLGVTGSFTSAGLANTGGGYVENCWVKSSAATVDNSVMAVFGNPSRGKETQLVNCYYPETNVYSENTNARGNATKMTEREFYNGTVAYNLNGFYLNKRYYDGIKQLSGDVYSYFKPDDTGTLVELTSYYPTFTSEIAKYGNIGYVEQRLKDGDFIYSGGSIPESNNERLRTETVGTGEDAVTKVVYYPIWPDDYIYFGQMLTYGYDGYDATGKSKHEALPSHIVKSSGRLPFSNQSNRVYRAPAYFRSKEMDVAHFNPQAYLAAYSAAKTVTDTDLSPAYPDMTAIDFAGHSDESYERGLSGKLFYKPMLDDNGLIGITNNGETPNLLVYAPAATSEDSYANKKTYDVLNDYFIGTATNRSEPVYSAYTESGDKFDDSQTYGRIAVASTSSVLGHLVQSDLQTTTDHLLVDKRDFNCPIAYTMGEGYRMWYQRTPDNFVTASWSNDATPKRTTKGWEGISLPFEAEIVATQDKGELTHFYQGSTVGHEYWLRELDPTKEIKSTGVDGVSEATFNPLAIGTNNKDYTNTFLWDYYYSKEDYWDKNRDEYQKQYYSSTYLSELYPVLDYPYSQGGKPYIIGFPGSTYYEFDLSGIWTPANRYLEHVIPSPGRQTVTFVSPATGITIGVSDNEQGVSVSGYTFKPSYMAQTLKSVAENDNTTPKSYALNAEGNAYTAVTRAADAAEGTGNVTVLPFRPYFTETSGSGTARPVTRSIIFSNEDSQMKGVEERGDPTDEAAGTLNIYAKKHKIIVESALTYITDVRIVNTAGITIKTFTIEPGETVETRIYNSGVYIVQTTDGLYNKKLAVK